MIKIVLKVFTLLVLAFIYTIPSAKAETSAEKIKVLALGNIKDSKGIDSLINELKDNGWYIRKLAAEALGKVGDRRAIEPLIFVLKDEDGDVRTASAKALDKIDPNWKESEAAKRSVPDFIAGLNDKQWVVREAAVEALGKIEDRLAIEPLMAALKDDAIFVREAAEEALDEVSFFHRTRRRAAGKAFESFVHRVRRSTGEASGDFRGVDVGHTAGSIVGAIIGVIVMFRIHPLLGILTAIGALAAIVRM